MSLIWPQLYQHRPGRKLTKEISGREEVVREESRFLCHRYLSRKMRRSGLALGSANLGNVKTFSHRTDEHSTLVICQMIETMEHLHPDTFNNVAANMHVSSFNERLLCQDFSRFAEALFVNGIKWPLILAYYAFCGGLAEECVRHGNARLITSIMNWSDCYVSMYIATWIKEQGGWAGLIEYIRKTGQISEKEVGTGRLARFTEMTASSLRETTRGLKRKLMLGEGNDKHIRTIVIISTVVFVLLYCIVISTKMLLGKFSN